MRERLKASATHFPLTVLANGGSTSTLSTVPSVVNTTVAKPCPQYRPWRHFRALALTAMMAAQAAARVKKGSFGRAAACRLAGRAGGVAIPGATGGVGGAFATEGTTGGGATGGATGRATAVAVGGVMEATADGGAARVGVGT